MKGTATEIANEIRTNTGMSQSLIAEKMGIKQQTVGRMLNNKDGMRTDNFVKMLGIMGAEVVVRIGDKEYILEG